LPESALGYWSVADAALETGSATSGAR